MDGVAEQGDLQEGGWYASKSLYPAWNNSKAADVTMTRICLTAVTGFTTLTCNIGN
jgi:hypothetical protein